MSDCRARLLNPTTFTCWMFAVLLPASVVLSAVPALAQDVAMDQLEKVLLTEKWEVASTLLEGVTADPQQSPNPVLRLIKGHVQLVQNNNNDSVCLFLSVTVPEDLKKCRQWSVAFLDGNSSSAIAYYFRGDVESRLHNYDEAIEFFTSGLKKAEGHVLLRNARGVASAHTGNAGQIRRARADLRAATSDPKIQLADAYANLGAYRIQRKDGVDQAVEAFNKAIDISPDFALALHGRGCMRIIQKRLKDAEKDLEDARKNGKCAIGLLTGDLLNAAVKVGGVDENGKKVLRLALTRDGVGTEFTLEAQTFDNGFQVGVAGEIDVFGNTGNEGFDNFMNIFNYGGVLTTFEQSVIDEGEWPFTQLYGLTFDATAKDAVRRADTMAEEEK